MKKNSVKSWFSHYRNGTNSHNNLDVTYEVSREERNRSRFFSAVGITQNCNLNVHSDIYQTPVWTIGRYKTYPTKIIFCFSDRRQHVSAPWSSTTTGGARAQHELFELLERVQCSRLDDQRAVLPPYFSQVSFVEFDYPFNDRGTCTSRTNTLRLWKK